ncbi:thioesterase [Streptomyces sp. NBRC 110611]|uniref:thioesterase II family protein n=1 Tax=Streptomyces sp. NBRC 110611 TaxID=1621259 RepID=UPI00083297EC|nr:alpha/beta fold hydrolase [Streptomyces sp. NBRC 110611]GAU67592.1 thioesterase [Streptomyces sp. NBRC 110611]
MTTRPDDHDLWIRRFHPAPDSAVQLVCLPHAGGSASAYFRMSEALAPSVEVLAVQYPGRQDRRWEAPARSVDELARSVAGALKGRLDRPVAVFGHSMGAAVAFELTRLLEREHGAPPVALFASGRRAPSCVRQEEPLRTASDDDVVAEMKRLSGTDARILEDADLLRIFLPVIRADYAVAGSYRCEPGARVRCPVTVLVGDADPEAGLEEARTWREHTSGDFEMHVYPGGHFYLDDYRSSVANVVSDVLLPVVAGEE